MDAPNPLSPPSDLDLDTIRAVRAALREELALVHERLTTIEQRIALLPDLHFLYASPVAQQVVQALHKAEAKPPEPHVGLTVPPGDPGRLRRPT
jgi:hypothetical protein